MNDVPARPHGYSSWPRERQDTWYNEHARKEEVPPNGAGQIAAGFTAKGWTWRDPATIPPRQWLYGKHYVRKYVSATIAPGGLGKSSLILVEALEMASGRALLGGEAPKRLKVWYFNLEDPLDEIGRRIAAVIIRYGLKADDVGGRLFINSGCDGQLIVGEKLRDSTVIHKPVIDAMIAEIKRLSVDALIIDPFVSCHRMPENDNGAIDAVAKAWAHIANETNCAVEIVHHVRKPGGASAESTVEDARGASSLINAVRSARVLNVMSREEAEGAGIDEPRRRGYFRVDNGKANLAPPMEKAEWRKFVSVPLGNGTADEPGDSIGVVEAWQMPSAFDGMTTADLLRVQQKIAGGQWREDPRAAAWAGHAVAETLGLDLSEPTARANVKAMLQTWIRNKVLKIAVRAAGNRHAKKFVEVGEWAA